MINPVGPEITLRSPLQGERFVSGESVQFHATIYVRRREGSIPVFVDESTLQWISDLDGQLGSGPTFQRPLSAYGMHTITIDDGHGARTSFVVNVYSDLGELYRSAPSSTEVDRLLRDFTFEFPDDGLNESWASYDPTIFDQMSALPSKLVGISRLEVLRHQRFSEPLPYGSGETISMFDRVHAAVRTIQCRLDNNFATGARGVISLNRGFSTWLGSTAEFLVVGQFQSRSF